MLTIAIPDWPEPGENGTMQLALLALLLVIIALLVMRAINRERREYGRFKRLRSTLARQKVYRKWLIESFLMFAGLTGAVLLASSQYVPAVLVDARGWRPLAWFIELLSGDVGLWVAGVLLLLFVVAMLLPLVLLRGELEEIPTVGDIRALLPRSRPELGYGAALSINAGVFEELLFRLALPALIFGIVGDGAAAFGIAAVLFGILHLYQGVVGVLASTVLGLAFSLIYVLTGSILVAIVVHVLVDLRSLVLIPAVMMRVRRRETVSQSQA